MSDAGATNPSTLAPCSIEDMLPRHRRDYNGDTEGTIIKARTVHLAAILIMPLGGCFLGMQVLPT